MSIEATKSSRFLLHSLNPPPVAAAVVGSPRPHSYSTTTGTTSSSTDIISTTSSVFTTMMSRRRPPQDEEVDDTAQVVVDTSYLYVLLDRFISASTGDDVTSSLQSILDTLSSVKYHTIDDNHNDTNDDDDDDGIVQEFITMMTATTNQDDDDDDDDIARIVLTTLLHIFSTSQFPKNQIFLEEGMTMVGRIYTLLLQRTKNPKQLASILLLHPHTHEPSHPPTGRFIEACIDVASATVSSSSSSSSDAASSMTMLPIPPYPRVLALQLIQTVALYQPSLVQHQLLSTPNGIHRLGDLLLYHPTHQNPATAVTNQKNEHENNNAVVVPEEVQLAMITLSVTTLSKWSSVAKIWIFNEIIDHIIRIAIQQEGGIFSAAAAASTNASSTRTPTGHFNVVMDCLVIVQQLLSHDTTFGELVLQSSTILINHLYYNIFDLRNGSHFRNPPTWTDGPITVSKTKTTNNRSHKSSADGNDDDDDDLDDLIASASTSKTVVDGRNGTATTTNGTTTDQSSTHDQRPSRPLPMLTELEEQMIHLVLDILCTLLENPKISTFLIQNHANFCTLLWEMGLLTIPLGNNNHTDVQYTCAIPSVSLQQRALHVIGTYLNSMTILEQHIFSGYDRLLYLVCTGMGGAAAVVDTDTDDSDEDGVQHHKKNSLYRISQAALYVVRRTIPKPTMNDLLMYTLAPPPTIPNSDDDNDGTKPNTDMTPNNVTIVSKLLRTVYDNLLMAPATTSINDKQQPRLVCLSGALGALSLFMTDDVNRSILFRITTTTATTTPDGHDEKPLLHCIFDCLVEEITNNNNTDDYFIAIQLLRFLCTWITDTPEIVQAVLNDATQSMMQLSQFVVSGKDVNGTASSDKGGVVVAVLIHLLFGLCLHSMNNKAKDEMNTGGWTRSNIVSLLQRNSMVSQHIDMVKNMKYILPWSCSSYEWNIWTVWYNDTVRVVRQRIIQELVNSTTVEDSNVIRADGTVADDGGNDNNTEARHSLLTGDDVSAATMEYRKEAQTMRNLVTDLTQETERLRLKLNESEHLIATQGNFI